uniref:Zinc-binding protein A33-like n=2 Tax=Cyprinus carpio TaxID=7962 RepID=A0A8C1BY70_CYPCA
MAYQASFSEEDLHCPVCFELFTNPVVLECSHSFCKTCIDSCWNGQFKRICPVCRTPCLSERPPASLVLRNIVESFRVGQRPSLERTEQSREESQERESTQSPEERCSVHRKRFFFFCEDDQEALCMVCQRSKRHKDHQIIPLEEAAQELKKKVRLSLRPLKEDLMTFQTQKEECLSTTRLIKEQTKLTRRLIKKDFEQLHHFLRLEEAARISMLEDEAEMKSEIIQEKLEDLSNKIVSFSHTIQNKETDLEREDIQFLQAYKSYTDSVPYNPQDSNVLVADSLIDVAKHLGNLKFKVWEKMLGQVQYSPIIMDPNTAAKWLKLSEDLTSVHYGELQSDIPDNPERFDLCVCVLGNETLGAGVYCWEVEVGNKTKWDLGVVMESVSHQGILNVNSECGFWALALREGGQYSASTKPWTRLYVKRKPHRIRVCLNNNNKEISFYDPLDMTHIYTFSRLPTKKLIPFFSPCVSDKGRNTEPLRVVPVKVAVTITSELAD